MATIPKLTHKKIEGLSTDNEYEEFYEEEWPKGSFGVRVSGRTGKKSFILSYRNDNGKLQRMTLGEFGGTTSHGLSLAEAREKAYQILGKVSAGEDPAQDDHDEDVSTVNELTEMFLKIHGEDLSEATVKDYRSRLERDAIPAFGEMSPNEVTRSEISQVLDHIAIDRDSNISANRLRSVLHKLFEFAIARGIVDENPVSATSKYDEDSDRDRVLDDDEIITLWKVLEDQNPVIESLFKMLLLCGQRSGETKETKWEHIEDGVWTIPPENAKNSRKNEIPLSEQAQQVLNDLKPVTGEYEYVYESPSPMVENQPVRWFSNTLSRLREEADFYFTAHDLRRTCASGMARIGIDRLTIAKVINHKSMDNNTTAIYDRYDRKEEKQEALDKWGKHVAEQVQ